ncbi:MAG: efflux RND transporter periplasmic adaptor subunit [Burkholderiales bacterium]|nr:efflux RND transporter periplasmic adaptor subunit [Burkholderiales bacterium]
MKLSPPATRRIVLVALGAALALALAFVALRSGPLAATRVGVVQAVEGRLEPTLFGVGSVEARRSYLIGPTAAARVRSVAVDVGDAVRAGQPLAEMDPVDLDQRGAALDASIARAASATVAAEAQRRDALARHELAAANARRYRDLGAQDFVSAGAVEARRQEEASAEAALGAAQANLAAARLDEQRLASERAGLRVQRASVRLIAPDDAVVTSRDAEPGSTVVAGQAVLRLVAPSSLWIRVRFDQGRSAGLAAGLRAQIVLRSDPGRTLAGRVARVEPVSDSITEERMAQVSLEPPPAGLSVGEMAEVTLTLPATARSVLLPNAAIRQFGGRSGVWTLDGKALRFAPVRLGQTGVDGQVQVLQGVAAGTTVVVYSDSELGPDSRVRVVDSLVARQP